MAPSTDPNCCTYYNYVLLEIITTKENKTKKKQIESYKLYWFFLLLFSFHEVVCFGA